MNVHSYSNDNSYVSNISSVDSNHIVLSNVDVTISSSNYQSVSGSSQSMQHSHNCSVSNTQEEINQMNLGFKCKGFRIGHINIQGVGNTCKIDQVKLLLTSDCNQGVVYYLSKMESAVKRRLDLESEQLECTEIGRAHV